MASENVPCLNPRICGVQTHRPGTEARCRKGKLDSTGAPTYLAAPPPLGNKNKKGAPTVQLNTAEEADYAKATSGETIDFYIPGNENATRIVLAVNDIGEPGDLYGHSDNAIVGKIVTPSGTEVWAGDRGAVGHFEFSEGDSHSDWVHPIDKDGNVIADEITYDDFRQLKKANDLAYELGWAEEVNPDGSLSQEDMSREVIRRVHAEINRVHQKAQDRKDQAKSQKLKKQSVEQNPEPKAPESFIDFLTERRRS